MSAVEPILAGRPVVTNSVVPALEVVRPACLEAKPDDVGSYVDAILRLLNDEQLYQKLCAECPNLQKQFYDREQGFEAALRRVIDQGILIG